MNDIGALRQSPEAGTESVTQLVIHARSGRIRIPEFQRDLRWQAKDVLDLFDSIYRGLPVGSLLFWRRKAKAQQIFLGPLAIDAPETAEAWWVVDGQQRVTSLAAALARETPLPLEQTDPYVVYFDALKAEFSSPPAKGPLPIEFVPLPVLLDPTQLSEWVQDWKLMGDREVRKRVFDAGSRIRDYKIPRYLVDAEDDASGMALLREIFYRVNKKGKALEWPEVYDALYGEDTQTPTRTTDLADQLEALGMGRPQGSTLTTCLLALRGLDVTRPLSEYRDRDPELLRGAVSEALPALRRAFEFLRTGAQIPHLRLLPRTFVLDVLTRFFALHPRPNARTLELLTRWLWRVMADGHSLDERTLERRAISSINSVEEDTIQAMLKLLASTKSEPSVPLAFDARAADSRLASIALASFTPLDLHSGEPVDIAELFELRGNEAMPKIIAGSQLVGTRGPENRLFSKKSAIKHLLLTRIEERGFDDPVLWSHAIGPRSAAALAKRKLDKFLRIRRNTLQKRIAALAVRFGGTSRNDRDRPTILHIVSDE